MREYNPPLLVCTGASECMGAQSNECHSVFRDFPELRVYSRRPLDIVSLGFRFGRVGMRYVEVACVSTSVHPCFAQVPKSAWGLSRTHATPALMISRSCASIPDVPCV